jgi:hypothetical protein
MSHFKKEKIMDKTHFGIGLNISIALVAAQFMCLPAVAQVSEEVLDSISTPNKVETSIGTLEFIDGAPLPDRQEGPASGAFFSVDPRLEGRR